VVGRKEQGGEGRGRREEEEGKGREKPDFPMP